MRLPKSRPARVWTRARRRRSWRAGARARISRPRTSGRASSASKACRSSSSTNGSPSRARRSPKRCSTPCSKRRKSPRLPRRNEAAIPMDRPPAKAFPVSFHPRAGDAALARRLSREIEGEVLFDPASRGRYSTDASIYQIDPGVVLDGLNAQLRRHGLWFPVDVSTSAQATLGGMAGNNSCGSRSIRYGNMVHNVLGIDALLADGSEHHFGVVPADISRLSGDARYVELAKRVRAIAEREAGEIEARWPKVLRRVQGYNLDWVRPAGEWNFAQLLVGSEGTLAYSKRIHLKLSPLPRFRTLGVCHFRTFRQSMEAPQHIVKVGPTAVELVDRTMIGLARANPAYRA